MSNRPSPEIERTSVTLSTSSTGWVSVALPVLGRAGKVLSIKLREDATDDGASAGAFYLTDGAPSGTVPDEDVFYASGELAFAGSAAEASLRDVIPGGAPYRVASIGGLYAGIDVSATTGATTFYLDVIAEVWA